MIDYSTITIDDFKSRAVAIDTEYHTDSGTGAIDRVYCVCASDSRGRTYKRWIEEGEEAENILNTIAREFEIEDPIFVAHAYDLAERLALRFLHADPYAHDWFCTYHGARVSHNAFKITTTALTPRTSLSYAALVRRVLGVEIDTAHKEAMRQLCITGGVHGHEEEIMAYCLSDTSYLIPLALKEVEVYASLLPRCLVVHAPLMCGGNPLGLLLLQCQYYNDFGRIAEVGFPVSVQRLGEVTKRSILAQVRLIKDFAQKYPGTYTYTPPKRERAKKELQSWLGEDFDLSDLVELEAVLKREIEGVEKGQKRAALKALDVWTGKDTSSDNDAGWHAHTQAIQGRVARDVETCGYSGTYPKTPTGAYVTGSDTLKDFFKGTATFCDDLYHLHKKLSSLRGASGDWAHTLDVQAASLRYRSLRPFASATGRCQGKPGDGFVLGWAHYLYGVLEPPSGKWLVELDFTAEETGIQAVLCHDPAYYTAYGEKDIYCWMGSLIGAIPQADYQSLSKSELKEKYGHIRSRLKTFFLAWGYGCGVEKLGARAGLSVDQAKSLKAALDMQIFKVSTEWKKEFCAKAIHRFMGVTTPDGWTCRTRLYEGERAKNGVNSLKNFPFQAYGAFILRRLATRLVNLPGVTPVATMHDAVMFLVDEGDTSSIESVKVLMEKTANDCLGVQGFIRVGSPDIVKHGEVWGPDPEDVEEFQSLLATSTSEEVVSQSFDDSIEAYLIAHPGVLDDLEEVACSEMESPTYSDSVLDFNAIDISLL